MLVAEAMTQRTPRILHQSEGPDAPHSHTAQVERLREFNCRLLASWAIRATCMPMNLWTMSHRLHDRERDARHWGCDVCDPIVNYIFGVMLRLISGMYDDESARTMTWPHMPTAGCPEVAGAIRPGVVAIAACHSIRAHRRDEGIPSFAVAQRSARAADALAHAQLFWPYRERRIAPHGPQALARPPIPARGGRRMRPHRVGDM